MNLKPIAMVAARALVITRRLEQVTTYVISTACLRVHDHMAFTCFEPVVDVMTGGTEIVPIAAVRPVTPLATGRNP